MAVYKATYCYPNLSAVDIRTAMKGETDEPVKYLKCKVDTSNKDVTGYSIRLLDGDNNAVFESARISPVSELQALAAHDLYEVSGTNSGMNGTYLQIPFFQNAGLESADFTPMLLPSFSAIYYKPRVACDYAFDDDGKGDYAENIPNWEGPQSDGTLRYTIPSTGVVTLKSGEALSSGDIVLIGPRGSGSNKSGIWRVSGVSADGGASQIVLSPVKGLRNADDNKLKEGDYVAILKGGNSGYIAECGASEQYSYIDAHEGSVCLWQSFDSDGNLVDVQGIKGLNGDAFKWEITLYQGDAEAKELNSPLSSLGSAFSLKYIEYDKIENGAFDMTLTSGTILGSTASRIQISDLSEKVLPKGQNGTLVLQTRYMDISNVSDAVHNGTRVYVETYDSSYGHAYPIEGDLDATAVANSSYVQFFKHSNNPDDILAGDKVTWATTSNVSFFYCQVGDAQHFTDESKWRSEVSATNRLIRVGFSGSLPAVASGDSILLMGQTEAKQNGVWRVYSVVINGAQYTCLKRATSYKSWSAYIGKVIYSPAGDAIGNFESLANAGTYSLWDPHEVGDGDSELLFTQELPMLLFPQLLPKGNTFSVFFDGTAQQDISSVFSYVEVKNAPRIDDSSLNKGDLILTGGDWRSYTFNHFLKQGSGDYRLYMTPTGNGVGAGSLFYITGGRNYGHRAWKRPTEGSTPTADWSLFTAKILKNTPTKTYISPFTGIKEGMRLKLSNGRQATFAEGGKSSWVPILAADGTFYSITHDELAGETDGAYPEGTEWKMVGGAASYGLISDETSGSSAGTPWKYEIRSHYKASDENVIYLNSDPYLIAYKDGEQATDCRADSYFSKIVLQGGGDDDIYLLCAPSSPETYFMVRNAEATATGVTGRSVELGLKYVQGEGVSWESCRWTLLDADGNILQDTGKMYGGDMSVAFYGLANDTDGDEILYYAVAYVEDELGNSLRYVIKLPVVPASVAALQAPFEAKFDCKTESVELSYSDTLGVPPTYKVSGAVMQAYDSSSASPIFSLWDGGAYYGDNDVDAGWKDKGYVSILDEGASSGPLVDSPYGSNTKKADSVTYDELSSNGTVLGLSYSHAVDKDGGDVSLSDGTALVLSDSSKDDKGALLLTVEFSLDDDFSGDALAIDVERSEGAAEGDPGVPYGTAEVDKQGYLTVGLFLPPDFTGSGGSGDLSAARCRLTAFIEKDGNSIMRKTAASGFDVFEPASLSQQKYYLQFEAPSASTEYLRPSFGEGKFLWKGYNGKTGKWFSARSALIGNLNLVGRDALKSMYGVTGDRLFNSDSGSSASLAHWAEDMYHLDIELAATAGAVAYKYMVNATYVHVADAASKYYSDGLLSWPGGSDGEIEAEHYWNESSSGSPSYPNTPLFWEDVSEDGSSAMEALVAHKRREESELRKKTLRAIVKITDVKGLYDGFDGLDPSDDMAYSDGMTQLGGHGTIEIIEVK